MKWNRSMKMIPLNHETWTVLYPQIPTGEILATKVAIIKSANQHGTEEFSIIGMLQVR